MFDNNLKLINGILLLVSLFAFIGGAIKNIYDVLYVLKEKENKLCNQMIEYKTKMEKVEKKIKSINKLYKNIINKLNDHEVELNKLNILSINETEPEPNPKPEPQSEPESEPESKPKPILNPEPKPESEPEPESESEPEPESKPESKPKPKYGTITYEDGRVEKGEIKNNCLVKGKFYYLN